MTRTVELTPLLKSLKLGALAATLPERIALARREQLDYASFLEIILSDEVNRRAHRRTELRLQGAGFEETCRLEDFDWSCCLIEKCYRNSSTWGPPQPALIPALQGVPPWARQPRRRPALCS